MKTRFLLSLLTVSLGACTGNFLDVTPQTERTVTNFYRTGADFNNAVIGTYAVLKNGGLYGNGTGALMWLGEISTDNTDIGATRQPVNLNQFEIDDLNFSLSNSFFSSVWIGHYMGIGRANGILDRIGGVAFDATLKNQYEGEARFLRAMFYFNLVRLFGDVPLVTSEIDDPYGASNLTRTPATEVYALIVSDLTSAEEKLPATIPAASAGRASRWAAKALLGKVLLTLRQYDWAAAKLKEVVDAGSFSLLPNYADVFAPATPYATVSREVLFAVQYRSGQIGQGNGLWGAGLPFLITVPEFGITGGTGGGVNRPTADLIAAYETGDTRRAASVATSYRTAAGATVNERYQVKFRQLGQINGDTDVEVPVLRFADVLLMQAEALNEQGQTAAALVPLNQVRRRAGLPERTGLSQADFRLAVEQERRVELAFENHRWFDLVRTNRLVPVLTASRLPVKETNRLYPIPQREIDLNKALSQNPGY